MKAQTFSSLDTNKAVNYLLKILFNLLIRCKKTIAVYIEQLRKCPIELPNVQECDATGDDSSNAVGYQK